MILLFENQELTYLFGVKMQSPFSGDFLTITKWSNNEFT